MMAFSCLCSPAPTVTVRCKTQQTNECEKMGFSSNLSFEWLRITSSDCQLLFNNDLEMYLIMHNYAHLRRNMFGLCLLGLLVSDAGIPIILHLLHCINVQQNSVKRQARK